MSDIATDNTGYRPRRYYLIIGVIGTVCFTTMGIVSTVAAIWNIDGSFARPILAALIFGVSWSAFMLLSVWVILAYFREILKLEPTTITQHGIIRIKSFHIDEVTGVRWRRIPQGGSIVVRTAMNKLKIHLDNFTTDERHDIITFFHDTFSQNIQEGWPEFANTFELQGQTRNNAHSQTAAVICALLLFSFGGIFTYCWIVGMGAQWLVIGIVNVLAAVWYLWRLWLHGGRTSRAQSA